MKEKVYLRIGKTKTGYKYAIDKKKNHKPFDNGYYHKTYFPTIVVGLNLEILDTFFDKANAELDLKIKDLEIATEIKIEEDVDAHKSEGEK